MDDWNLDEKPLGIISIDFDSTHGCPLKNENDILDNPIPCKLTLSVYSIWSINYRYDPKYTPQYKSKHTNYVKLADLVL
jgi:hypothetical protein